MGQLNEYMQKTTRNLMFALNYAFWHEAMQNY